MIAATEISLDAAVRTLLSQLDIIFASEEEQRTALRALPSKKCFYCAPDRLRHEFSSTGGGDQRLMPPPRTKFALNVIDSRFVQLHFIFYFF